MDDVLTTIILLSPGVDKVTEIKGSVSAVNRFIEDTLSKKATKLSIPSYSTPIYVLDNNAELVLATIEWEKIKTSWVNK